MKRINNKGYMLVEIILAFSITFVLIYFVMNLIIKLKNKNDDLLVETLIRTDQTIITNKLMSYAITGEKEFNCDVLKNGITDNSVKYNDDMIDIVSKYAKIDVSNVSCSTDLGKVSIKIPLNVEQMKDEDFDVIIDYKYDIGDMIPPRCSLSVNGTTITATYEDPEGGSGILYYGWDESKTGENSNTMEISGVGTYTFYVVDNAKNENSCSISIVEIIPYCATQGYSINGNKCIKTEDADKIYKATGWCRCESNGGSDMDDVDCHMTNPTSKSSYACNSCPSGYYLKENHCGSSFSRYSCSSGTQDGSKCIHTKNISYKCETDYIEINDNNSYCYKVIN